MLHISWNDQRNIKIDTNLHRLKKHKRVIISIVRNSKVFLLDLVQMKWQVSEDWFKILLWRKWFRLSGSNQDVPADHRHHYNYTHEYGRKEKSMRQMGNLNLISLLLFRLRVILTSCLGRSQHFLILPERIITSN